MFCEYCNAEFKTLSSLNNHKIKAKYCLTIQGKIEPKKKFICHICEKVLSSKQMLQLHIKKCEILVEKESFNCEYCKKKLSTKQILQNHINLCGIKKDVEINEKDKKIKEQEQVIIKLKTQNENYKDQIKELQEKLDKVI
jgi:hypothetical protein